jgi:hypothetical protein
MKTTYVLIDFENVHVKSLALLKGDQYEVKVFIGPKNSKLPVDLVLAMHDLGPRADYIQLGVSGRNALDFHIVYYLGKLTAKHRDAQFHIISKDTDFDSLIKHLQSKGIHCKRSGSIELMPGVAPAAKTLVEPQKGEQQKAEKQKAPPPKTHHKTAKVKTKTPHPKPKAVPAAVAAPAKPATPVTTTLQTVIDNLQARGSARPRTIKTLTSSIKSLRLNLSDEQIAGLIAELQALEKLKVNGVQVAYKL